MALPQDSVAPALRARFWVSAGTAEMLQGDYGAAERFLLVSIGLADQHQDKEGLGKALTDLGQIRSAQRQYAQAEIYFEKATHFLQEDHPRALGHTLICRSANHLRMGQAESALELGLAGLRQLRQLKAMHLVALALACVANALISLKRLAEAEIYAQESLTLSRGLGESMSIAESLTSLGDLKIAQKRFTIARQRFLESLGLRWGLKDHHGVATNLGNLAQTELFCAQPAQAAFLARIAQREFKEIGVLTGGAQLDVEEILRDAGNQLREEDLGAAMAAADVRSLAEVLEALLESG